MNKTILYIVTVLLSLAAWFINLFTLVKVWAIIAVPMGAPPINKTQAFGVVLLVLHMLYPSLVRYKLEKEGGWAIENLSRAMATIVTSLTSWGLVHWTFG